MLSKAKKKLKGQDKTRLHTSAILIWTAAILITCLAAVIRLHKLGAWSFWVDEIFTLEDSTGTGALGLYHGGTFPLSYMLIAMSIHRFGISEWSLRIVPALFGIATPAMVYLLARKSFGDLTSFAAAAIIAISPWHLYWSQMARFYTMTLFFSAASILVLHRGLETNRKWLVALAGILMALGALSHYSALLMLAGVAVYVGLIIVLRWQKPHGLGMVNTLIFLSPFIIGAMLIGSKAGGLIGRYAAGYPTGTVITSSFKAALYMLFSTGYRLEATVAVLALIGAGIGISRKDRSLFFVFCAAIVPLILLIIVGMKSHAENRYAFVILPPVALLAGRVISTSARELWKTSRILAITVPVVIALPMLQHDISYFGSASKGERWNYRAAAQYLKAHASKGDVVYSPMPKPMEYYLRDSGLKVKDLNLHENLPASRNWLVMEDVTRGESVSNDLAGWLKDNCDLSAHFSASSPMADYGLSVYRRR
jgi:hypothetical protein